MNAKEIDVGLDEAKVAAIKNVNAVMGELEAKSGEKFPDQMDEGLRMAMELAFMLGAGWMRAELHTRIQAFVLERLALRTPKDMTVN